MSKGKFKRERRLKEKIKSMVWTDTKESEEIKKDNNINGIPYASHISMSFDSSNRVDSKTHVRVYPVQIKL
jgi:hypothetical protein